MKLDEQSIALFRAEVKGIKPLIQDKHRIKRTVYSQVRQDRRNFKETQAQLFYFSDEYHPLLQGEGVVKYLREGENPHLLKQLRRGDFSPEIFLDLHGLTREQAKLELAALLNECEKSNLYCASIMTGYGGFTLKEQIPRWLVQHPKVRALHQAPKEWGGGAAFLILFEIIS